MMREAEVQIGNPGLERRSRWYVLAFAGACALGSVLSPGSVAIWTRRGRLVYRSDKTMVACCDTIGLKDLRPRHPGTH
jgi:hypothetical protein